MSIMPTLQHTTLAYNIQLKPLADWDLADIWTVHRDRLSTVYSTGRVKNNDKIWSIFMDMRHGRQLSSFIFQCAVPAHHWWLKPFVSSGTFLICCIIRVQVYLSLWSMPWSVIQPQPSIFFIQTMVLCVWPIRDIGAVIGSVGIAGLLL